MEPFVDINHLLWEQLAEEITGCRLCPRLVEWREEVARTKRRAYRDWEYWGKPITGFGDRNARVLVVGLAPGAHGANRTGRVFTGDGSGEFLFRALHKAGFANQSTSVHSEDGLALTDMYISAVCRCAPPENKPGSDEIVACLPYLEREFSLLLDMQVVVLLGKIAFDNTLRLLRSTGHPIPSLEFGHGAVYPLEMPAETGRPASEAALQPTQKPLTLLASYHPSRQNTQTGRLTEAMFDEIWQMAKELLK